MARLTTLSVRHFGPFEQAALSLRPLTVLVGPNDSGKSSLLNAIIALSSLANGSSPENPPGKSPTGRRRQADESEPMQLKVRGQQDEVPFTADVTAWSVTASDASSGHFQIGDQHFDLEGGDQLVAAIGLHTGNQVMPWAALQGAFQPSHPRHSATAHRFNTLGRCLRGVRRYQLVPKSLRSPSPASHQHLGIDSLTDTGFGLPTLLANLAAEDVSRAAQVQTAFCGATPTLAGYKLVPTTITDGPQQVAGFRLEFPLVGAEGTLGAHEVSDGVLLLLTMLALVHHPRPPTILLIEEPENGVHPSRLSEFMALFRQLSVGGLGAPPTQVILTTHAPYLLDEVAPHEAFFCHRLDDGRATCTCFGDLPGIEEELADKLLGELWAEHGELALYERANSS